MKIGTIFPLEREQDGVPKNLNNIPGTSIPNFMEIQQYLGKEKSGQKWSGELGEGGNDVLSPIWNSFKVSQKCSNSIFGMPFFFLRGDTQ